MTAALPPPDVSWAQRAAAIDWPAATEALHQHGHAVLPALLEPTECAALARLYERTGRSEEAAAHLAAAEAAAAE